MVEVAAQAPVVRHPMWACFDERGRLFVAESGGLNLNAEDLQKNPPSSILLLQDSKGDGHFRTIAVDTTHLELDGSGQVDLGAETLALKLPPPGAMDCH